MVNISPSKERNQKEMGVEMKILEITGEYFKGIKRTKTFAFEGKNRVVVRGKNGSGKTTLFDMVMFVFCGTDSENKSNPNVKPNDIEECTPTVTISMLINGNPVKVSKIQTIKKSKPDANGISKVSLTNTYTINDVPKTERDFKADLELLGLDLTKMAYLSNSDVFMALDKKEQRKILFELADTTLNDQEIALKTKGCEKVASQLSSYKVEEVEAMNKATLKKIDEVYGKNGELLNAQIEGLEMAKVDIDVSAIELERAGLEKELTETINTENALIDATKKSDDISSAYMLAKFELGSFESKFTQKATEERREIEYQLHKYEDELNRVERDIANRQNEIETLSNRLSSCEFSKANLVETYKKVRTEVISDDATICPTCGQEYPADRVEKIKSDFATSKANRLENIESQGKSLAKQIEGINGQMVSLHEEIDNLILSKTSILEDIEKVKATLSKPVDVDSYKNSEEYKALVSKVETLEKSVAEVDSLTITTQRNALRERENEIRKNISECDKQIASWKNNADIDDRIVALREKQIEFEQQKAFCDEIIYEIGLLKMAKNNLLTDSINKHFKNVKFAFWETYKNGEYKETVIAYSDGKRLGESMNTALMMRSKIDICAGLSDFYGQNIPIFVDAFESIDSKNAELIEVKNQLIALAVSDDNELVIN